MPKIQKEIQQYLCGGHRTCGRLAIILTFTLLHTLAKPSIQKCANVHKKMRLQDKMIVSCVEEELYGGLL